MAASAGVEFDAVISVAVEPIDALAGWISTEGYFALRVFGTVVASAGLIWETDSKSVAEVVLVAFASAFSRAREERDCLFNISDQGKCMLS